MTAYAFNRCRHQHEQRRIRRWQIRLFAMPEADTEGMGTRAEESDSQ